MGRVEFPPRLANLPASLNCGVRAIKRPVIIGNFGTAHRSGAALNRLLCGVAALLAITSNGCRRDRRPDVYLIPNGYVGQIAVEYHVRSSPTLPQAGRANILRFPPTGILATSSAPEYGFGDDEFYYVSPRRDERLFAASSGEGGMIWEGSDSDDRRTVFIGTEKEYKKLGGLPRIGPLPVSQLMNGIDWSYRQLQGRRLEGAHLQGAIMEDTNLSHANLRGADLSYSVLQANFSKADLSLASLQHADLLRANLKSANLQNANLAFAKVEGADFQGANLNGAILAHAQYDRYTKWPRGFDQRRHGAERTEPQPIERNYGD